MSTDFNNYTDYDSELSAIIRKHHLYILNSDNKFFGGIDNIFYPLSKSGLRLYALDGLGASRGYVVSFLEMWNDSRFFNEDVPTSAGVDILNYLRKQLSKPENSDEAGKMALQSVKDRLSLVKPCHVVTTSIVPTHKFFSKTNKMDVSESHLTDEKMAEFYVKMK